ncbi:DUF4411 family protein [Acinetobacter sp. UGAL515B_02]|nr:DUF4411 family protein [Acinetobacter sp. UGAL515B_02]WON79104.1 DUF4411 family protein [Acinetobacter sp. UGAL515B_02]
MIKICLDTNAILDICYRYYPVEKFQWIWDGLLAQKSSRFICFYICRSIEEEVRDQIERYNYDPEVYEHFLSTFQPTIVHPDEHGQKTSDFKTDLLTCPIADRSPHVNEDNYADLDIVSLGSHFANNGFVLTSEQKTPNINWERRGAHKGIKVPNLAERYGVNCGSWINLIDELGLS